MTDGRTVGHCEILDGMSEWVGRVVDWVVVIAGCEATL